MCPTKAEHRKGAWLNVLASVSNESALLDMASVIKKPERSRSKMWQPKHNSDKSLIQHNMLVGCCVFETRVFDTSVCRG